MVKKFSTSPFDDENTLIDALLKGDAAAFEYVVPAYHNLLLSVARAIVNDSIADEVVQDGWLSALKALPKFERKSSLKTWLVHIVSNAAKSRVKRENRFSSLDSQLAAELDDQFDHTGHRITPLLPWEDMTPEDILANEQLQAVIEQSFQQLPTQQRAVLRMIDIEGYSIDEVCNILDLSSSNGRVLLHRARITVHAAITDYQGN